ncbi:large ribosomal subunit protein bL35m [Drosophila tropicalis]|uniref:large ribosomal subunit protein bL35m n=1 Tax=Drosophila tropicalis TaxID=46794 RepID=UPI0035ABF857
MLRTLFSGALRSACRLPATISVLPATQRACFSQLMVAQKPSNILPAGSLTPTSTTQLLQLLPPAPATTISTRTVTKFSLIKGKRKTSKAVLKRFKRLDWGAWIRTHTGRHKKMFKKSSALRRRLRQHVFTNATQSWLLDKLVTNFWRRPKHYIDDPYAPYHKRPEYFATKGKTFKV